MEGSYPILIDGAQTGVLTVTREGLMTTFLAECADPGWLVRLAVYGAEGTGYLGVMIPEGGRLRLKKRLSRAALAGFPKQLSFAGPAGMETPRSGAGQAGPETATEPEMVTESEPERIAARPVPEAELPAPTAEREAPAEASAVQAAEPAGTEAPAAAAEPETTAPPIPAAEPEPPKQSAARPASPRHAPTPPVPEAPGDINWFATPEGILVGTDGTNELVAIEADDVRLGVHGRGVLRRIEGKNYMIFKAHNGVASIR